jgi:hypothetical protein
VLLAAAGCATSQPLPSGITQVGPYQVRLDSMVPAPLQEIGADPAGTVARKADSTVGSMFTQPISDPFIASSQANALMQAFAGPNQASQAILDSQNYYRDAVGAWNNPWLAFFTARNGWLR